MKILLILSVAFGSSFLLLWSMGVYVLAMTSEEYAGRDLKLVKALSWALCMAAFFVLLVVGVVL